MKLGIDIGGTSVPFGLVDDNNFIVLEEVVYIKDFNSIEELLKEIKRRIDQFDKHLKLEGVGIGAPNGHFKNGTIENAPNLPWKGIIPLKQICEDLFSVRTVVDNDANVAALGEAKHGNGKKYNSFVHLTLGTGLGSGIIINQKVYRGATEMAGELGHTIVEENGRQCKCGKKGCLETYASVTGLWKTAVEFSKKNPAMDCDEMNSPYTCSTKMFDEAKKGNPNALALFDYTGQKLALGIANVQQILGTEAFILGGGLAKAGQYILDPTRKYISQYAIPLFSDPLSIELTASKNGEMVILGAVSLLYENE